MIATEVGQVLDDLVAVVTPVTSLKFLMRLVVPTGIELQRDNDLMDGAQLNRH